jgi:hypothetical protein
MQCFFDHNASAKCITSCYKFHVNHCPFFFFSFWILILVLVFDQDLLRIRHDESRTDITKQRHNIASTSSGVFPMSSPYVLTYCTKKYQWHPYSLLFSRRQKEKTTSHLMRKVNQKFSSTIPLFLMIYRWLSFYHYKIILCVP